MTLNNTLVGVPATITMTVTAVDDDGTITKVQFYRNGSKIGEKLATPFTFTSDITAAGTGLLPRRRDRRHGPGRHDAEAGRDHRLRAAGDDAQRRRLAPAQPGDLRRLAGRGQERDLARHHRLGGRPVRQAGLRLPELALQQGAAERDGRLHDARSLRRQLPVELAAGDVRARPPVAQHDAARPVHERRVRAGPAAPARRVGALADPGDLGGRGRPVAGLRDGALPATAGRQRLRQLRDDPQADLAVAGDGQLARRGQQRPART